MSENRLKDLVLLQSNLHQKINDLSLICAEKEVSKSDNNYKTEIENLKKSLDFEMEERLKCLQIIEELQEKQLQLENYIINNKISLNNNNEEVLILKRLITNLQLDLEEEIAKKEEALNSLNTLQNVNARLNDDIDSLKIKSKTKNKGDNIEDNKQKIYFLEKEKESLEYAFLSTKEDFEKSIVDNDALNSELNAVFEENQILKKIVNSLKSNKDGNIKDEVMNSLPMKMFNAMQENKSKQEEIENLKQAYLSLENNNNTLLADLRESISNNDEISNIALLLTEQLNNNKKKDEQGEENNVAEEEAKGEEKDVYEKQIEEINEELIKLKKEKDEESTKMNNHIKLLQCQLLSTDKNFTSNINYNATTKKKLFTAGTQTMMNGNIFAAKEAVAARKENEKKNENEVENDKNEEEEVNYNEKKEIEAEKDIANEDREREIERLGKENSDLINSKGTLDARRRLADAILFFENNNNNSQQFFSLERSNVLLRTKIKELELTINKMNSKIESSVVDNENSGYTNDQNDDFFKSESELILEQLKVDYNKVISELTENKFDFEILKKQHEELKLLSKNEVHLAKICMDEIMENHTQQLVQVYENKIRALLEEKETDIMELQKENEVKSLEYRKEVLRWKNLFIDQFNLRKKLHNKLMDVQGQIRVFCRVRPMLPHEEFDEEKNRLYPIVDADKDIVTITVPPRTNNNLIGEFTTSKTYSFEFDNVFDHESRNEEIYTETEPFLSSIYDGFSLIVLFYGQTGSGKTFSMTTGDNNNGLSHMTLRKLFLEKENYKKSYKSISVYLSIIEIYNENVYDLLGVNEDENNNFKRKSLTIRSGIKDKHLEIVGLNEILVNSAESVSFLLNKAHIVRQKGSTESNDQSSRSHLVLSITVKGVSVMGGETQGKLYLIDLAGSERISKTGVTGDRLIEAKYINRSLSALSDCLNAIAQGKKHVPFRNSKLTFLLSEVLNNCKLMMFLHVSPSSSEASESLASLQFGSRCRKSIKIKATVNKVEDKFEKVNRNANVDETLMSPSVTPSTKIEVRPTVNEERNSKKFNEERSSKKETKKDLIISPSNSEKDLDINKIVERVGKMNSNNSIVKASNRRAPANLNSKISSLSLKNNSSRSYKK